ncbi:MAG: hypothetical protein ABI747_00635 [Candidatus Moraniibacteriota bacterium]
MSVFFGLVSGMTQAELAQNQLWAGEYYHEQLNLYVMLADPAEIAKATTEWGWVATGGGFIAFKNPTPDTLPVCRFWNSISGGHFFSNDPSECEKVRNGGSPWADEGIRFHIQSWKTKQSCPEGQAVIYRALPTSNSNHRYIGSSPAFMYIGSQAGWVQEGAVFCSPFAEAPGSLGMAIAQGMEPKNVIIDGYAQFFRFPITNGNVEGIWPADGKDQPVAYGADHQICFNGNRALWLSKNTSRCSLLAPDGTAVIWGAPLNDSGTWTEVQKRDPQTGELKQKQYYAWLSLSKESTTGPDGCLTMKDSGWRICGPALKHSVNGSDLQVQYGPRGYELSRISVPDDSTLVMQFKAGWEIVGFGTEADGEMDLDEMALSSQRPAFQFRSTNTGWEKSTIFGKLEPDADGNWQVVFKGHKFEGDWGNITLNRTLPDGTALETLWFSSGHCTDKLAWDCGKTVDETIGGKSSLRFHRD